MRNATPNSPLAATHRRGRAPRRLLAATFPLLAAAMLLFPAAAEAQFVCWFSENGKSPGAEADLLGPDGAPVPLKAFRVLMHTTEDDVMDVYADPVIYEGPSPVLASIPDGGYLHTSVGINWEGGDVRGKKFFC